MFQPRKEVHSGRERLQLPCGDPTVDKIVQKA